jgi:hypothetical protein
MEAVSHWDALPAWNIYKELEVFLKGLPKEQGQSPVLAEEIVVLKRNLLMVGFPVLPQTEAEKIYREHILDFFRVDVDFKERLSTRYIFDGYGGKEEDRKRLLAAVLQNSERLGQFTIGEWIKLFEQRFKFETRNKKTATLFLTQTSEAASLGKNEQVILGKILAVYDEYICREAIDDLDIASTEEQPSRTSNGRPSNASVSDAIRITSLPLLQALSKYENLGNQLITGERLKIKSQAEPVRPSLLYWVKYYRDEMGIGQHNSVERGQFLFRSENGRKLSAEERERVNLILKSIEENFPLSIDPGRQEIIFPAFQGVLVDSPASNTFGITSAGKPVNSSFGVEAPARQSYAPDASGGSRPSLARFAPRMVTPPSFPAHIPSETGSDSGRPVWQKTSFDAPSREESISSGMHITPGATFAVPTAKKDTAPPGMSFTAKHVFPAEKEIAPPTFAAPVSQPQSRPSLRQAQAQDQSNPFIIHPTSRLDDES